MKRLAVVFLALFAWTIEASAAIGTPAGIGTASYADPCSSGFCVNPTTSLPISVTSAVAVNNTVIVTVVLDNSFLYPADRPLTVTVTDSASPSNSYTKDADIANTDPNSYMVRTLIFSARVTTALTASSTITVHFSGHGATWTNASAFQVSGLAAASRVDQTATGLGTSLTASVGPTATTAQADELLIGAFGLSLNSDQATFTPTAGYFPLDANFTSYYYGIYPEYRIVSAIDAYTANGRFDPDNVIDWAAAIVTYKAAGTPTQLVYTTVPSTGIPGVPFSVTVQSQDANGNPAPPTSDTTITLSIATGGGTLSGKLTGTILTTGDSVTIATPVYSMPDTMRLTATATEGMTELPPVTSGPIVFSVGTVAKFHIEGSTAQTAGTSQNLTITAQDAGGNTVPTYAGSKNLTFSGAGSSPNPVTAPTVENSSGTPVAFGSTTAITFTGGVATVSSGNNGVMTLYKAETAIIVATQGSITTSGADRLTVTVSPGALGKFAFVLATPQANAVAFTGANTLTALDSWGNTVTTFEASANNVTIAGVSPLTGTVSGLSGGNKLTSASDFSSGVANLTALGMKYTGVSGTGTFTATGAGKTGTSGSVVMNPGSLASFLLTLATPQAVGAIFTATSTLTAKDVSGNTITSFNASTDNVTITANAPLTGTVSGLGTGVNNVLNKATDFSSGAANLSSLGMKYSGNTGTGTFTATSGSGKTGTSGNVVINAGAATKFHIDGSTAQTAGTSQNLTITAQDAGGNTVTSYTGSKSLTFSGAGSSPNPVTAPTVENSSGTPVAFGSTTALNFTNGVATVSGGNNGVMVLYDVETAIIVATQGSITTSGADRLTVTVSPGGLGKFALVLATPQTNAVAFTGVSTLTAQDNWGNAVTSFDASASNVTITGVSPLTGTVSGLGTGGNNVLNRATDFSSGVANMTALGMKYTGASGTGTFTATSATKTGTSGSVVMNPGSLASFVFTLATPQTVGVSFTATSTLTAKDVSNNTITTFNASADNVTITANTPLTGTVSGLGTGVNNVLNKATDFSSGAANLNALGMKYTGNPGTGTFTATSASGKTGTSGNVQINAGTATKFVITGTAAQTAGTSQNLTITAQDAGGNTATSYTGSKSLTFSGAGSSPNPVTAPTVENSSGTATAFGSTTAINFTNGVATVSGGNNGVMVLYDVETAIIVATQGSITTSGADRLTVTVNPGGLGKFAFVLASPQSYGVPFTGVNTLTALDSWGNTLTGFDASANNVTITANSPLTGMGVSGLGLGSNNVLNQASDFSSGVADLTTLGMKYTGNTGSGTFTATATGGTGTSGSVVIVASFRSQASGNWATAGTWEVYNGSTWVTAAAAPSAGSGPVMVQSPHTVTVAANVSVDQVTVQAGGQITVNSGVSLTVAAGPGTDLDVSGIVRNAGTMTIIGSMAVNSGGKYQHNQSGGTVPTATWNSGSTFEFTATSGSATTGGVSGQSFHDFVVNGSGGTLGLAQSTFTVAGDFTMTAGTFDMKNTSTGGGTTVNVTGNWTQNGGTITRSSDTGNFVFTTGSHIFTKSSGTISSTINFTVNSGATLQMAAADTVVSGGGTFTLSSGATLGITSPAGIMSSGATGNIQTTSRSFSTSANYIYNRGDAQNSGSGLTGATSLTVSGSGTYVTLTNGVTVSALTNIDAGTLDQNCNLALSTGSLTLQNGGNFTHCITTTGSGTFTTTGSGTVLTVNSGSTFDYVGTGTITLSGNVSNAGTARINGGTLGCGGSETRLTITSSSSSTHRTWDGAGKFLMADLILTRQDETLGIIVYGRLTRNSSTVWTNDSSCAGGNAPTAVSFHSFAAVPQDGGVLLKWRSGEEVSNIGYHVYRDGVRVTRSPIAGSALLAGPRTVLTAGNSYTWFDAEGTSSSTYTIEDLDLNRTKTSHGPFYVDGAPAAASGALNRREGASGIMSASARGGGSPLVSEIGRAESGGVRSFDTSARAVVGKGPRGTSPNSQQYTLAAAKDAVKIGVQREGWYRVSASQLASAGMPAFVNPDTLQLFVNGEEQDILVTEQGGRVNSVEFYGMGIDTTWSDTQVYWLTWGTRLGQRIQPQSGKGSGTAPASFPFAVQWRPRTLYIRAILNGDADNFFGPILDSTAPVEQTITIGKLNTVTAGSSRLEVRMQGLLPGAHVVEVRLNGKTVGTISFDGQANSVSNFDVPNTDLVEGANALTLTALGGEEDWTLVDTVLLTYPRSYTAEADSLQFTAPAGRRVTITGFSKDQIRVMDVTDPGGVTALQGTVAEQTGGGYSISVVPQGGGTRELLAFTDEKIQAPSKVTANQPSSWNASKTGADMVIVSHGDFVASLAPLVALRQSQGRTVAVVNVEDLYDEFNYGAQSPYALKSFLRTANSAWKKKPRWVLLVGDGNMDPRDYYETHQVDYLPVELVATAQGEAASDDWYVDLNDDGLPEMAVGRLPAGSTAEAVALAGKIVAYENAGAVDWKSKALLVAGTNDKDNNFEKNADAVADLLPKSMTVSTVLQGSDPAAAASFMTLFNSGQGLVDFSGHGSMEIWKGGLFDVAAAASLTNGVKTPFVISMTCLNGYFQDVWSDSLAEALLKAPGGGAVGVWASSGLTESASQATMNQEMIKALYGGAPITVGEAAMAAKKAVSDPDVVKSWNLLGDPAMTVR